jgi:hypothetical protein
LAPPPPQRAAASRLLRAGPPASAATGTQCLRFPPLAGSLSPPWISRPRVAVSPLAFSRSVQEPQTRLTPPLRRTPPGQQRGQPPGSSRGATKDPRFRCHLTLFDASTAHAHPGSPRTERFLERLPGPHLTRSRRAFSLDARHDSLQLTQLQSGLTPTPAGPTPKGQQASISCTAPPMSGSSYTIPPSAFVTHW